MNIVNLGGLGILVNFIATTKGDSRLHGIVSLGFIISHNEKLADAIIDCKGVHFLREALENEKSINVIEKHSLRESHRKNVTQAIRKNKIYPYPIFKIKDLPNQEKPFIWFENMESNSLNIPTFIGKFKELIWDHKPQMILEDSEGNEIKILLIMDEEFDSLQEWMLDLKYEIVYL